MSTNLNQHQLAHIELGAVAETVTAAVMRALDSHAEFRRAISGEGAGVIIHPEVRFGGRMYLGNVVKQIGNQGGGF